MLDGHPSLEVLPQDVANQMIPHPNHPRPDFQDYHSSVVWKILSFQQRYTSNKIGQTQNFSTMVHILHSIFLGHMVIRKRVQQSQVGNPQGFSSMYDSPCMPLSFHWRSEYVSRFHANSVLTYRQNDCSPEILIFIKMGRVILIGRKVGVVAPTSLPFQI